MNSIKFKNNAEISKYIIEEYFINQKCQNVIIPSGSTPKDLYEKLSIKIDNKNICYFALDEWLGIGPNVVGSCSQMITADFLDKIDGEYTFRCFNGSDSFESTCCQFKDVVENTQMDLAILGVGLNGHIGLNEKTELSTAAIIKTKLEPITKKVANEKYFSTSEKVEYGITFSLDYLLKARTVLVILNTENKKDIWNTIQTSNDQSIPAVYLKQFKNVKYLVIEEIYE